MSENEKADLKDSKGDLSSRQSVAGPPSYELEDQSRAPVAEVPSEIPAIVVHEVSPEVAPVVITEDIPITIPEIKPVATAENPVKLPVVPAATSDLVESKPSIVLSAPIVTEQKSISVPVLMQPLQPMPQMMACFGPYPQPMLCPYCQVQGVTFVTKEIGLGAWLLAGGLCCFGCICCAPIPLLIDSTKDSYHKCSSCQVILGTNKLINL